MQGYREGGMGARPRYKLGTPILSMLGGMQDFSILMEQEHVWARW